MINNLSDVRIALNASIAEECLAIDQNKAAYESAENMRCYLSFCGSKNLVYFHNKMVYFVAEKSKRICVAGRTGALACPCARHL